MKKVLVAADYAQLEVRTSASRSQDPVLLEITNADPSTPDGNLHAQNMKLLFGIPYAEQYKYPGVKVAAKKYIFTWFYGGRERQILLGLEEEALKYPDLGIEVPDIQDVRRNVEALDDIYKVYAKEYKPAFIEEARERGGIAYTDLGRPRFVKNINSSVKELREAAEREVVSHGGQGTAADIARAATNAVERLAGGELLLQVHDELVSVTDEDVVEGYRAAMVEEMLLGQPLRGVPLVVDAHWGYNWRDCHK